MVNLLVSLHDNSLEYEKLTIPPRNVRNKAVPSLETFYDYAVFFIHPVQQTDKWPRSTTERLEQGVKHNQSCQ